MSNEINKEIIDEIDELDVSENIKDFINDALILEYEAYSVREVGKFNSKKEYLKLIDRYKYSGEQYDSIKND